MKSNIVMISISLLTLLCCIVLTFWIQSDAKQLQTLAHRIEEKLPEDPAQASQALDALNRRWARNSITWQYIAMHDDMHEISEALVQLNHSYQQGCIEDALLYCRLLLNSINMLIDKEEPVLQNIL